MEMLARHLASASASGASARAASTVLTTPGCTADTSLVSAAHHTLKSYTLVVTGASRGIGLAIALAAARQGANIAIWAKTATVDPRLPGTIFSAKAAIEAAGGAAEAIVCDVRSEESVDAAVAQTIARFGGCDILVNNASAISLTGTDRTPMKRYDLMSQVNARGTYMCSAKLLPYLRAARAAGRQPHILNIAPPLDLSPKWFAPHVAYTMAKYGMSLCTLGMAEELREAGVAVNSLWPRTAIATAAVKNLLGGDASLRASRTPEIMADAALAVLCSPVACTGNFYVDEDVLRACGVTDFAGYRVDAAVPEEELMLDFFLPEEYVRSGGRGAALGPAAPSAARA